MPTPAAGLPATLRAMRMARGWSQTELARRAACKPRNICAYERGRYGPSLAAARRIAEALRVSLGDLLADTIQIETPCQQQ